MVMDRFNTKWTRDDKNRLTLYFKEGLEIEEIAKKLGRTEKSILSRLEKLGLRKTKKITGCPSSRFVGDGIPLDQNSNNFSPDVILLNKIEYKDNARKLLYDEGRVERSLLDAFYFIYLIVNKEQEVYIGASQDVIYRVYQHNKNQGGKTTTGRGPWYPFTILCVSSKAEALSIEARSKREFSEVLSMYEMSLKETLARIGVELNIDKVKLLSERPEYA